MTLLKALFLNRRTCRFLRVSFGCHARVWLGAEGGAGRNSRQRLAYACLADRGGTLVLESYLNVQVHGRRVAWGGGGGGCG